MWGPGFTVLERGGSKKPKRVNNEPQQEAEWASSSGKEGVRLGGESQARNRHVMGRSEPSYAAAPETPGGIRRATNLPLLCKKGEALCFQQTTVRAGNPQIQ